LHLVVLFTLVIILLSVRLFFTLAFNSTLRLHSIVIFTRKCISVNPHKCISVKSTIIFYACIQEYFTLAFNSTFYVGAYFTEQYFTLHLHFIVLFTLVLILLSVRYFFTLAFDSTLCLHSIILFTLVLILLSSTLLYACIL